MTKLRTNVNWIVFRSFLNCLRNEQLKNKFKVPRILSAVTKCVERFVWAKNWVFTAQLLYCKFYLCNVPSAADCQNAKKNNVLHLYIHPPMLVSAYFKVSDLTTCSNKGFSSFGIGTWLFRASSPEICRLIKMGIWELISRQILCYPECVIHEWNLSMSKLAFFKPLLFYFRLFCILIVKLVDKICRWRDSDRGSLVSEATALPTEPQYHYPCFGIC